MRINVFIILLFLSGIVFPQKDWAQVPSSPNDEIELDYTKKYNDSTFGVLDCSINPILKHSLNEVLDDDVDGMSIHIEFDERSHELVVKNASNTILPLDNALVDIYQLLSAHPERIFTLILDYDADIDITTLIDVFSESGIIGYCYVMDGNDWPTLQEMVDQNKRLMVYSYVNNESNPQWMKYLWNLATEPYYASETGYDLLEDYSFKGRVHNDLLVYNDFQKYTTSEITWSGLTVNSDDNTGVGQMLNVTDGVELIRAAWLSTGKRPNFIIVKEIGVFSTFRSFINTFNVVSGTINADGEIGFVGWSGMEGFTGLRFSFPVEPGEQFVLTPVYPGLVFDPETIVVEDGESLENVSFDAMEMQLTEDLEACFLFDGDVKDYSIKKNNGESQNINFINDSIRGIVAKFSEGSEIILPLADELNLNDQDFTISAWVNIPEYLPYKTDYIIIGSKLSTYQQGLHTLIRDKKPYFSFYFNDLPGNTIIEHGEWHQLVWRYSKAIGEMSIFVDGNLDIATYNRPSYKGASNLYVGAGNDSTLYMTGLIDELCIWSRSLSNEEVVKISSAHIEEVVEYGFWDRNSSVFLFVGVLLIIALVFIFRKRFLHVVEKKLSNLNIHGYSSQEKSVSVIKSKNYIKLFGGFKVLDCDGDDISGKITGKVKQLFLLLLVKSNEEENGITNDELLDILWGDNTLKDVQNTKRVTMRKLRLVLDKVKDIEIVYKSKKWQIILSEDVTCDYSVFLKLIRENIVEVQDSLLSIISEGELFKDENYEWLVEPKEFVSNAIVDISHRYILSLPKGADDQILKYADIILTYDPLDENALRYKLNVLISQNNYKLANFSYEQFCSDYIEKYGEEYPRELNQFMG